MKKLLFIFALLCFSFNTVSAQTEVRTVPEEPGETIPELYGFWRVLCIDDGKNKIRQPKQITQSGILFSKLNEHKTGVGSVSFNVGCTSVRGLWFRHHGNGDIEMPTGITETYDVLCPEYNHEIRKLIPKLIDRFHVRFIQNNKMIIKNDSIEVRLKRVEQ